MASSPNKPNPRLIVLSVIAAILGVTVVGARFTDSLGVSLSLPATIRERKQALTDRKVEYRRLLEAQQERTLRRQRVLALAEPLWRVGHRPPQAVIQEEFRALARRAHVLIRTLGSPRVSDYSDNIQQIQLTVRIRGDMEDVGNLLAEVDRASPPFFWQQCSIRPDNPRDPKGVILSGQIAALMLKSESTRLLEAVEEGSP